jgi:hypothetical protein
MRNTLILALFLFWSAAASSAERFGDKGTIAPSGEVGLTVQAASPPGGGGNTIGTLTFSPGAMFFITDGLAVGGSLQLQTSFGSGASANAFGLAPTVGYNIRIGEKMSFFPNSGFAFTQSHLNGNGYYGSADEVRLTYFIQAPLLFHFNHFYVGFGPNLSADLWAQAKSGNYSSDGTRYTTLSVTSVLGGWF